MLAVITTPRSGSSYFCSALSRNGAGQIQEYLNFDNPRYQRICREKTPREYWQYIVGQGGLKLFRENLIVIQSDLKKHWPTVLFKLCDKIIYLHREDVVERSISQFIASHTRIWQVFTDEEEEEQRKRSDAVEYDFSRIYHNYLSNLADDAFWTQTLPPVNGPRFRRVQCESFLRTPEKVMSEVLTWLGHDTVQLDLPDDIRPAAPKRESLREQFEADLHRYFGHCGVDCPTEFINLSREE
jgi:LPS sulfotransferase NodH